MKKKHFISSSAIQLALGVLIGFFVLSQSAAYTLTPYTAGHKSEKKEEQKNEQQQLKLADAVTSSPIQISLDFQSFLLETILQEDTEEREATALDLEIPLEKALKVLFRHIISPNAP